ncbi:hypothetical protein B0T11DRAFT_86538 [Plectosphaerella cucumerina]|uniref:MARVEL domain-containing protein n=1 Tax=Plectosphaerella cucumerina TaxID=40658 RepID=A0A8K0THM4_9PEZI|nr:hypothetical protein B0T11DRAFT_86538 [Plectosphaerella cucumerina]
MDAQESRPAEDATPATTPVETKATPVESPAEPPAAKSRVPAWLLRNTWRNDGRKRGHLPDMPVWIAMVRILQIALCIATLALTAYGTVTVQRALGYRRITNWSGSEGYPFSWFAFSWTFTYLMWLGTAVLLFPMMYNCWVQLGLELLTLVFWLITTALLASHSDDLDNDNDYVTELGPAFKKYQEMIQRNARGFVIATFAATGTATANCFLFIVTLVCFGRALHNYRVRTSPDMDGEKSPGSVDDPDKAVSSPQMSGASSGQPPWTHHHHYYPWYPPPPPQQDGHPAPPMPPYPYMPGYYPPPPGHPYPPPPSHQQGSSDGGTPFPPHSPWHGSAGPAWPQHQYDMYQQQVPIAAHHTGQSGGDLGTPQFPVVAPVMPSKLGLDGSGPPPPLQLQTAAPGPQRTTSPYELQSAVPEEAHELPAEVPRSETPPPAQRRPTPDVAPPP